MTDEMMTIRQMCDTFEVTPRTLRFYEAKELLFPLREGTKRLYGKADRARLKLILRGKRFGFMLEDIRQLLELYDSDELHLTQLIETCEKGKERLADMVGQKEELEIAIEDLQAQLDWGAERIAELKAKQTATD